MRWPRSLTRADSSPAPRRANTAIVSRINCALRLKKNVLVIPRSVRDEESEVSLDGGKLQIPRFARDDNNRRDKFVLGPISRRLLLVRLAFEPELRLSPVLSSGSVPRVCRRS